MSNVVLVIDMVRGFMEPGHNLYCGDEAREIIPNVQATPGKGASRRV